jgi:hypothetical protein
MFSTIKSWLLSALFLFTISTQYAFSMPLSQISYPEEVVQQVSESATWQTLLHIKNNSPKITDYSFLLSAPDFTSENELLATLQAFTQNPNASFCRFPARHLFLSQYFELPEIKLDPDITIQQCRDFSTYLKKVPSDQLSLVYASEVLSSASSMMGHVFLKTAGTNNNGNEVAHSVSFFTQYDTFNPFTLIYDGLIGGMEGFFIVRPYNKDLQRYSEKEQRNVFEYQINFDEFSASLVMMHIWELKDIEIRYLFQSYNCATLTLYVLSLGDPTLRDAEKLFVSPADVVKAMYTRNLLNNSAVTLANQWRIRMLEEALDDEVKSAVKDVLFQETSIQIFADYGPRVRVLALDYLKNLSQTTYIKDMHSAPNMAKLQNDIAKFEAQMLSAQISSIDFQQYKNPINSQQDSILGVNSITQNSSQYVDFTFLPASHYFTARNEQFFSESELKIGEIILRINPKLGTLDIQELTLYSVASLVPSSSLQPETSGNFYFGYKQSYNKNLQEDGYITMSGGIGKTYKIHRDVILYGILDVGLSVNFDEQLFFAEPKIGGILNLAGNVKFSLEHSFKIDRVVSDGVPISSMNLSWVGDNQQSLAVSFQHAKTSIAKQNTLQFSYHYHF